MWNAPSQETMSQIPKLYETEHTSLQDKSIYFHLFIGGSDWFIAEWDGHDIMFGFAIINGDYQNAEWGYISLAELKAINIQGFEIENDCFWTVCPAGEVRTICKAHGWPISQPNKYMANMTA